jgi:hypothetical protein
MSTDEADRFSIPEDDRRTYVRLDRAKLNIAGASGPATWFKLVSVRLDNGNETYPGGDEVQTVEPWKPPDIWSELDTALLNRILTAIEQGDGNGDYYTDTNSRTNRAAWEVVQRHAPAKSDAQAREIITTWLKNGVLVKFEYTSPKTRKKVFGLKVNHAKRPGTEL